MERVVYLSVHRRADHREPDAPGWPSKIAKTLPKGLPSTSVQALLAAIDSDSGRRASDWVERDRALILTSLLAGLRADELLRSNVGDVRRIDDAAVIHVRGKGGKDRRI